MFERFTDRARRVVVLAQEEARLLNHNYIGTEHLLLGLLHEAEGIAAQVLVGMNVSLDRVRASVEKRVGQSGSTPLGHIPFTPRAKTVLELSLREALQLGHNYIGTEHLLLGLVREGDGVAALTLREFGVELDAVRDSVIERMGGRGAGRRRPAEARGEARAAGPVCPDCHRALAEGVLLRPVTVRTEDPSGEERQVIVIYCEVCGRTFGVLPA